MRCADFYEKWKKDPNWCQKSPDTVREIDHYLSLVGELENLGVETAAIYKKFPEGVARDILKIKDEKIRASVMGNTAGMIRRGEKVSSADVKVWAGLEERPRKITPCTGEKKTAIAVSSTPDHGVKTKNSDDPAPVTEPRTLADQMRDTVPQKTPAGPGPSPSKKPETCCNDGTFVPASRVVRAGSGGVFATGHPAPPRMTKDSGRTLTIAFDSGQWETLKELQRAGQADGFEEAVKFCVDEVGSRAGGE